METLLCKVPFFEKSDTVQFQLNVIFGLMQTKMKL